MNSNQFNTANYENELEIKRQKLKDLFKDHTDLEIEVFASAPSHYRMRSEFRVWHDGEDLYYYMFDKVQDQKVRTEQFLPASILINQMMSALMEELKPNRILRHKLFQVDFLSTQSGEILVSLLYHRQLDNEWISVAKLLKEKLSKKFKMNLIGRARKQKIDLDHDFVIEELQIHGKKLIYKQVE